jgi:hypothetical protein
MEPIWRTSTPTWMPSKVSRTPVHAVGVMQNIHGSQDCKKMSAIQIRIAPEKSQFQQYLLGIFFLLFAKLSKILQFIHLF